MNARRFASLFSFAGILLPVGCSRPSAEPATAVTVASASSSPVAEPPAIAVSPATPPTGLLPEGSRAPLFEGIAQTGEPVRLAEMKGKVVVVYFYPKDDTPGCTKEACELRDAWTDLQKTGAIVIGISTNDRASHVAFAEKYKLPFLLVSDKDEKIANAFGVPVHFGFDKRVTFIVDKQGTIAKVFPDVTPTGHAHQILDELSRL